MVYGQSPFYGSDTVAISTTPIAGLKMFNGGARPADWDNMANFATLSDHVASGEEDGSRGVAEAVLRSYEALTGTSLVADGRILLTVNACQGSMSIEELSEGGNIFGRIETAIMKAREYCEASDIEFVGVDVAFWQGEAEFSLGTAATTWIARLEDGVRAPIEALARTYANPAARVRMVLMPTPSHFYYNKTRPEIAEAVLAICRERPDRYVLGDPPYICEYGAGGVGSHLLNGVEVYRAATGAGRQIGFMLAGEAPPALVPLRAWKATAKVVIAEYDVPIAPLQLNTALVADPGDFGFEIVDLSTGLAAALASVSITGDTSVRLVASDPLDGGPYELRYGEKGGAVDDTDPDAFGSFSGRTTGARGNLFDSTPDTVSIDGVATPMPHPAPMHYMTTEEG